MEAHVAGAVLLSAALHAGWNGLVKASRDPLLALAALIATGGACGLLLACLAGPPPRAAWPWLGASMLLHGIYHVLLARAARRGGAAPRAGSSASPPTRSCSGP